VGSSASEDVGTSGRQTDLLDGLRARSKHHARTLRGDGGGSSFLVAVTTWPAIVAVAGALRTIVGSAAIAVAEVTITGRFATVLTITIVKPPSIATMSRSGTRSILARLTRLATISILARLATISKLARLSRLATIIAASTATSTATAVVTAIITTRTLCFPFLCQNILVHEGRALQAKETVQGIVINQLDLGLAGEPAIAIVDHVDANEFDLIITQKLFDILQTSGVANAHHETHALARSGRLGRACRAHRSRLGDSRSGHNRLLDLLITVRVFCSCP
jgi:hypothetical protein